MRSNDEYLVLITKYLNSPSDIACQQEVAAFRSMSVENERFFLEVESVWDLSARGARLAEVDDSKSLQRFVSLFAKDKPTYKLFWLKGIAASLLIVAMGYWLYRANDQTVFLTKTTAKNQIDSVKLTDGSVIVLAENTTLRFPDKFDSKMRQVFLTKGQAFFKIAKDANHPFKVVMNNSDVMVLGTTFNIKLSEKTIELGVKTGRVMFSPYKDSATSILVAGQALRYDLEKKEFATKISQNEDSWLTKELIFVDTPLEEVCKQLTSYYGVEIKLQHDRQAGKKLNAKFHNQSLNDVLLVLNETYNIKIKKEKHQINLITP